MMKSSMGHIGSYANSTGIANIIGGQWTCSIMYIGSSGTGILNIQGGNVTSRDNAIGSDPGSYGAVTVASNGTWSSSNGIQVGVSGTGTLSLYGPSLTIVSGTISIASQPGSSGVLNLDGKAELQSLSAIQGGGGSALVNFNNTEEYVFAAPLIGNLSVNQIGSGTTVLCGTNNYTGTTSVTSGVLHLTSANLMTTSNLKLRTGGKLNLDFQESNTINELWVNGVAQSPGTWGGLASNATFKTPLITGSGILYVTKGPMERPYASWVAEYNLDNASTSQSGFTDVPARDGVPNGLKWVLGGNPLLNSRGQLPQCTSDADNFLFAFGRNVAAQSNATLAVEWSTDMIHWTAVPIGNISSVPDANGVAVTVTANNNAPDSVVVSIPRRNAASGRLFTRLKVQQ